MPYYIGDVIKDPNSLIARTPEKFEETGIRVELGTCVEGIETDKGEVLLAGGRRLPYDMLVVGTGAKATLPDIPGTTQDGVFTLKNLRDGINIKEYIRGNMCRRAVIVGAGFIAMEMSEALRNLGLETSVVYRGELPVKKWDPVFSGMGVGRDCKQRSLLYRPQLSCCRRKGLRCPTKSGYRQRDHRDGHHYLCPWCDA